MTTESVTDTSTEMHSMEKEHIAHLAGAFDVGGILTVHISKNDDYAIGYNIQPVCRMSFPMGDNDPLMGKMMQYCDDENIAYSVAEVSHGKDKDGMSYRLEIKRTDDIERFLHPMLDFLTSHYEEALLMLEEIIPRIEDSQHREREGFYELMEYADLIRSESHHQSRLKYTQDYFEEEWSIIQ